MNYLAPIAVVLWGAYHGMNYAHAIIQLFNI